MNVLTGRLSRKLLGRNCLRASCTDLQGLRQEAELKLLQVSHDILPFGFPLAVPVDQELGHHCVERAE